MSAPLLTRAADKADERRFSGSPITGFGELKSLDDRVAEAREPTFGEDFDEAVLQLKLSLDEHEVDEVTYEVRELIRDLFQAGQRDLIGPALVAALEAHCASIAAYRLGAKPAGTVIDARTAALAAIAEGAA